MGDRAEVRANVAVVGTGLIGGSILLRLHKAGVKVSAWDPDPKTRQHGRQQGLDFRHDLREAVVGRDVVFLGGPLPTLPQTLAAVAASTGDNCVITDVGSTKAGIAEFAQEHGLVHRFVPGHPMAGTERAGLASATADLFDGAAWVLCPESAEGLERFRLLVTLILDVFDARVVPMDPVVHDSVVALSSHVPHLLAGSLAGAVAGSPLRDAVLGLAAGSFRDGTRVAGTPANRTADMLRHNREYVLRQVESVTSFLSELLAALRADDAEALVDHYRRAQQTRDALLGRELSRFQRRFMPRQTEEELRFLRELGAAGGYVSACESAGGSVTYTVHQPVAGASVGGGGSVVPIG